MDLVEHGAAAVRQVLDFFGLAQRVFVCRFDADKDALEIGLDHQLDHLVVLGEIDRGLGGQVERITAPFLPGDNVAQDRFDRLLVADQIVIDDEGAGLPAATRWSSSAMTCALVLSRGLRPNTTMMSQNSQVTLGYSEVVICLRELRYLGAAYRAGRTSQGFLRAPQKPHKSATRRPIPQDPTDGTAHSGTLVMRVKGTENSR